MEVLMPASSSVTISGLVETIRSIRGLMRYEVQERLAREMDKAAQPILVAAKANIIAQDAIRSGSLFDAMVTVGKVAPNKGKISVIIGPKKQRVTSSSITGKKGRRAAIYKVGGRYAIPAKYAHLVEFGTKPHPYQMRTRQGIESFMQPGSRAKPFLGPAFDAASPGLIEGFGAAAGRVIEWEAKQAAKAAAKPA